MKEQSLTQSVYRTISNKNVLSTTRSDNSLSAAHSNSAQAELIRTKWWLMNTPAGRKSYELGRREVSEGRSDTL